MLSCTRCCLRSVSGQWGPPGQPLPPRTVLFIPPQQGRLSQPGAQTGSQPVTVSLKCLISILLELFSVMSLGICFLE